MTDPTADAAKLPSCPICKSEKPEWRRAYIADGKVQTCRDPYHDTRPQPAPPTSLKPISVAKNPRANAAAAEPTGTIETISAPPAGEPDFHRWLDQKIAEWSAAGGFHDFAVAAKVIRDRLGLAARPNVEDGEVAYAIGALRNPAFMAGEGAPQHKEEQCRSDRETAADLLERLARESSINEGLALIRQSALSDAVHRYEAAEAELAKVDGFLILGWSIDDALDEHPIARDVQKRHAARQQQKASAEPTAREEE